MVSLRSMWTTSLGNLEHHTISFHGWIVWNEVTYILTTFHCHINVIYLTHLGLVQPSLLNTVPMSIVFDIFTIFGFFPWEDQINSLRPRWSWLLVLIWWLTKLQFMYMSVWIELINSVIVIQFQSKHWIYSLHYLSIPNKSYGLYAACGNSHVIAHIAYLQPCLCIV